MTATTPAAAIGAVMPKRPLMYTLIVRFAHWINAGAMAVMNSSGWAIHNAYPTLQFLFPSWITLDGSLMSSLQWHFAPMRLVMVNGLVYLADGLLSRRLLGNLPPIPRSVVVGDFRAALAGRAVTRTSASATPSSDCSGSALSSPVSWWWCRAGQSGSRCGCVGWSCRSVTSTTRRPSPTIRTPQRGNDAGGAVGGGSWVAQQRLEWWEWTHGARDAAEWVEASFRPRRLLSGPTPSARWFSHHRASSFLNRYQRPCQWRSE